MVDRIQKFLDRLSLGDRKKYDEILDRILKGDLQNLDVKKLQGMDHAYRVRKGEVRIIFVRKPSEDIQIISIEYRSEGTYHL